MKAVKGNIFDLAEQGEFDVVVHGCNCFCTMGKGVAKEVKTRYPWVYEADLKTHKGDSDKLGTFSEAGVISKTGEFIIVNAYTQFHYWGAAVRVDYNALRSCFNKIKTIYSGNRIAYPKIGAGLAGGDWSIISAIIDEELEGEDHTLVLL